MYICIKRTGGYGLHAVACAVVGGVGGPLSVATTDYSVEIIASCGFCIVSVFDDQAFTCSSMLR